MIYGLFVKIFDMSDTEDLGQIEIIITAQDIRIRKAYGPIVKISDTEAPCCIDPAGIQ